MSNGIHRIAVNGRVLSRPERFSYYRGDIADVSTATRIAAGQAWRVQHMADRLNDLRDAALRFSNDVFEGREPDHDALGDVIDVAEGAIYDWGKNNARLEA